MTSQRTKHLLAQRPTPANAEQPFSVQEHTCHKPHMCHVVPNLCVDMGGTQLAY